MTYDFMSYENVLLLFLLLVCCIAFSFAVVALFEWALLEYGSNIISIVSIEAKSFFFKFKLPIRLF